MFSPSLLPPVLRGSSFPAGWWVPPVKVPKLDADWQFFQQPHYGDYEFDLTPLQIPPSSLTHGWLPRSPCPAQARLGEAGRGRALLYTPFSSRAPLRLRWCQGKGRSPRWLVPTCVTPSPRAQAPALLCSLLTRRDPDGAQEPTSIWLATTMVQSTCSLNMRRIYGTTEPTNA